MSKKLQQVNRIAKKIGIKEEILKSTRKNNKFMLVKNGKKIQEFLEILRSRERMYEILRAELTPSSSCMAFSSRNARLQVWSWNFKERKTSAI